MKEKIIKILDSIITEAISDDGCHIATRADEIIDLLQFENLCNRPELAEIHMDDSIETSEKLSAEEFLNSKGWTKESNIVGGLIFMTVVELLNEYAKN